MNVVIGVFTIGPFGPCPPPWAAKNLVYCRKCNSRVAPMENH